MGCAKVFQVRPSLRLAPLPIQIFSCLLKDIVRAEACGIYRVVENVVIGFDIEPVELSEELAGVVVFLVDE